MLDQAADIARHAAKAVLAAYDSEDFSVENKEDEGYVSPLTKADKASHDIIQAELEKISKYPVISEEGAQDFTSAERFWLVDPLDGTKEFISRNGEFTINIGLIEDGKPVLGVVYAPALGTLYMGEGSEAFKVDTNGQKMRLEPKAENGKPKIVISRNHKGEKLETILRKIGPHEETDVGSSLKFCLLAEGRAQAYPRFVPTYLWDTAAADAILRATGGQIRDLRGNPLVYEPANNIRNPFFIATARDNEDLYDLIRKAAD